MLDVSALDVSGLPGGGTIIVDAYYGGILIF